jgi:hypothetical protein
MAQGLMAVTGMLLDIAAMAAAVAETAAVRALSMKTLLMAKSLVVRDLLNAVVLIPKPV